MADAASSINGFAPLDRLETTTDRFTGRVGLTLFSRYLRTLGIAPFLERLFGSLRKSGKGLPVPLLFQQLFCFFLDGTNLSLTRFDELAEDTGYAGAIEVAPGRADRRKHPELVRVTGGGGYPATRTPMDHPAARALVDALRPSVGEELVQIPTLGGSLPMYHFPELLGTPFVGLPIVNPDNNQHSPNENLRLGHFFDGIVTLAAAMRAAPGS